MYVDVARTLLLLLRSCRMLEGDPSSLLKCVGIALIIAQEEVEVKSHQSSGPYFNGVNRIIGSTLDIDSRIERWSVGDLDAQRMRCVFGEVDSPGVRAGRSKTRFLFRARMFEF